MKASDAKRLKELEEENRKLNDMFATLNLKHTMLMKSLQRKSFESNQA
ncbi:hypothetical protein L1285_16035 [Pseudoalteromonas sp. DL2-H2.2]|nr:hypothetical protein [Pseudoalteromonas sp. DL2-H2.2]